MLSVRGLRPSFVSKTKVRELERRLMWDEQLLRQFDFQLAHPGEAGWKETSSLVFGHRDMWLKVTEAEWE